MSFSEHKILCHSALTFMPKSYLLLNIIWEWWAESDINGRSKIDILGLKFSHWRAGTCTHMHAHTHSNTGVLTCSQHYNVRQRLYYYNFIFKFQGKHKEWHSNNYLQMIYEMWFMSIIVYIIHKMIITLQRINYTTFMIIQSQHTVVWGLFNMHYNHKSK